MRKNRTTARVRPGDDVDEMIFDGEDYHESER